MLLILLVVLAAGGWYAWKEYYRTNEDLLQKSPDFSFSATELIAAFEKDTAASNRRYVDKVIAVSGNVKSIDGNGNPVVIALGETGQMSSIQCSMDSAHANTYNGVKEGDQLQIKGICTGGKTEDLFGTDVILNRCVVIK
jgi:hypothetical protein